MTNYLEVYNNTNARLRALQFCYFLESWDTNVAPRGCYEQRSKYLGTISEMSYELSTSPEYEQAVIELSKDDSVDEKIKREIKNRAKDIENLKKIPKAEYTAYSQLLSLSQNTYFQAKEKSDFEAFRPILEKIIEYNRNITKWLETKECKGYNILLDDYEEGFTVADFDAFFNVLKQKLVPFVKKVLKTKLAFNKSFIKKKYPADKQKQFAEYLRDVMCFDRNYGIMAESEHPYTNGADSTDVRITVHYYEENFLSSIFSAIHETGHATYERQVSPDLIDTLSGGGASMGMHESQSRFYENIIGRSQQFWQKHFPKLQEIFPKQLKGVTVSDMVKAVNYAQRSLIRTEADELTYCLHIMVRYDIEKLLISGKLQVADAPAMWNKLYKKYLGVTVPDDKHGILQDVHWSMGSIGYFPTYALGSAYAAQMYHKMREEIDVDAIIASGNLQGINDWLKEKVHRFGASKSPKEILRFATGEDFNAEYFVDYLINKYSAVYGIKA